MIGQDVVSMLNRALKTKNVTNVDVVAILNDTTGTLVAGAHYYPNCAIGKDLLIYINLFIAFMECMNHK